jgi:hypothetical protein
MKLNENEVTSIVYEKESGDTSARVILPVQVPKDLIRAIDMSELEPSERAEMAALHAEYKQYVSTFMEKMFNFETWAEHTHNKEIKPKWRAFKVSGLR